MRKIVTLVLGDLRNIRRDPFLLMSIGGPLLLTVVLRFGIPVVEEFLLSRFSFDLSLYYLFIMSFILILSPLMIGVLAGFLLLDERDEHLLSYYDVTPLRKKGYLVFRLSTPFILSCVFSFILLLFAGLLEFHLLRMLPIILIASLGAPLITLFLGVYADNKVEGLALSKIAGLLIIAPVIAYFVDSNVQFIAGILPPFWTSKAYIESYTKGSGYWLYLLIGFLVHGIIIRWLLSRFIKQIY